ncbi:hypothetical protein K438DRAFT_1755143 [Mycena galopus ATCC 62051]|nr:hypothetical protein K438DRAFT_1755143 [Mycena galopus ATCC 62051]
MEQVLFWLSRLGLRVVWSANYEQLLEQLFPDMLLEFPPAQHCAEFDCLRTSMCEGAVGYHPLGRSRRYRANLSDSSSGPDLLSDMFLARGSTMRFSTEGILEYLDELAVGDGCWVPPEGVTPPGHILVGAELDLWIIASEYLPHLFYGATLPTPPAPPATPPPPAAPPVPPAPGPSRVPRPPRQSRSQKKKEGLSRKHTPTEPWWRKLSNTYKEGDEGTLHNFRVEFWEHLGSGSFHPLHPDPCTVDLMETCHSYSYWEFLSDLRPTQHTARAETRRKTAEKASCRCGPTIIISSGSENEASSPEVIVVEDEEMPAAVDDLRNYDLGGDVPMPPANPSIAADPNNYNIELEPTLLLSLRNSRHPPLEPPSMTPTCCHDPGPALPRIVQWATEGEEDETRVESALLFMSAIFSQAGNTLGQQRRSGKGSGAGAEPFFIGKSCFKFFVYQQFWDLGGFAERRGGFPWIQVAKPVTKLGTAVRGWCSLEELGTCSGVLVLVPDLSESWDPLSSSTRSHIQGIFFNQGLRDPLLVLQSIGQPVLLGLPPPK